MKLKEIIAEKIDLYEMANVTPDETGLSRTIWISINNHSTGCRIKVMNIGGIRYSEDNFSVSVSDNPEIVAGISKLKNNDHQKIFEFVKKNQTILLQLWASKISYREALNSLKPV